MNPVRARLLEEKLRGNKVGPYRIGDLLNSGKTAAVFAAELAGEPFAVKIFDPDFIDEIGLEPQLERINRELELKDHPHENIVRIYDGGYDEDAGYVFLSMERLPATPLSRELDNIPIESINPLILQLVAAARHLESLELVHRDIKPDNINYLASEAKIKLLDFGVIRPFGEPNDTDAGGILRFIGTLQYSSPEFLLRDEEQSERGWRAVTIYQIGAVMHDLIMRRPIFTKEQYPFARLSNAVQTQMPEISNDAVDPAVINLALSCLVKDPLTRLDLVKWETFEEILMPSGRRLSMRTRVLARVQFAKGQIRRADAVDAIDIQKRNLQLRRIVCQFLRSFAREIRARESGFPPIMSTCDADQSRVRFEIGESRDFALATKVTVFVMVEVVEITSSVVRVSSKGYAGDIRIIQNVDDLDEMFIGPYEQNTLARLFEDQIYAYVDSAQQNRTSNEDTALRLMIGAET